jgi:hypothetical protein
MNRVSESYIATLNFDEDLKIIKERVKKMNLDEKEAGSDLRYRVCLRGRRPFKKMIMSHPHYEWMNSPSSVSYDYFGNIVGGLENASEVDVYVYER